MGVIYMKQIKLFTKEVLGVLGKPVMSVLPGHLSFFLLLSSIPIILIFGMVASAFSLSYDEILRFISLSLPATTSKLILPLFTGKTLDFSVVLLAISAIYLASRGTKAIIAAANNIYGVKNNPIREIVKSLIITLLLISLLVFIVFILVFGNKILEIVSVIPKIGFLGSKILLLIRFLRWPISFFIIFLFIKMIYTLTPNKKISSKSVNKGSFFTTALWIIITYIYSFYVTNYASYNDYYGSASNILVLMLWIFIISEVFVIGMVINQIEDKKLNEPSL